MHSKSGQLLLNEQLHHRLQIWSSTGESGVAQQTLNQALRELYVEQLGRNDAGSGND